MKGTTGAALLLTCWLLQINQMQTSKHENKTPMPGASNPVHKGRSKRKSGAPAERHLLESGSEPNIENSTYETEIKHSRDTIKQKLNAAKLRFEEDANLKHNEKMMGQMHRATPNAKDLASMAKKTEHIRETRDNGGNSSATKIDERFPKKSLKRLTNRDLVNRRRRQATSSKMSPSARFLKRRRKKKKRKRRKGKREPINVTDEMPYPFDGESAEEELEDGMYYEDPTIRVTDAPMFQLRYGPNGEVLDNPLFKRNFHMTKSRDYFQLAFPKFDPYGDRLDQIKSYLNKWMDINEKFENIYVTYWKMDEKDVMNRVSVSYYNRKTKINKDYIIDVDFIQEIQDNMGFIRKAKKIYGDVITDEFYDKNFIFTNQFDCQRIRTELGKPKFFVCNPQLNKLNFFIPNLYTVDVMLKGQMYKNQVFNVVPFTTRPGKELEPDSSQPPKVEEKNLYDMIFEKASKPPKKDRKYRRYIMRALGSEEFMERITKFEDEIDKYNEAFGEGVDENVEAYQIRLRSALFDFQKELLEKGEEFEEGYKMLDSYVEKVNIYNILKAKRYARHRTKLHEEVVTYFTMKNKIIVENQMKKIYGYLDYMRFYKDQRIEKKILAGYNSN